MSKRRKSDSSSSGQSARRSGHRTRKTSASRVAVLPKLELVSGDSPSPIEGLYETAVFRLAWDNNAAFHVANHCIHLRKYRKLSQAQVGRRMQTSQSKLARIEGADENITLKTLEKLVSALKGRLLLAIEPAELSFPRLPAWWDCVHSLATSAANPWNLQVSGGGYVEGKRKAAAGWVSTVALPDKATGTAESWSNARWLSAAEELSQ